MAPLANRVREVFVNCLMSASEVMDDIFAARPGRKNNAVFERSITDGDPIVFHRARLEQARGELRELIGLIVGEAFFDWRSGGQLWRALKRNHEGVGWGDDDDVEALLVLCLALDLCLLRRRAQSQSHEPFIVFRRLEPACPVHVLFDGEACCAMRGVPSDWPEGHTWVRAEDSASATCRDCLEVAVARDGARD